MITLDALRSFGANVDEGLSRCMNNEAFYLRLVGMAAADSGFSELSAALEKNDLKAAFEAAHKLKGVFANLSLTPLFTPASELTELLRNGTPGDYDSLLSEILRQKALLEAL